MLHTFDHRCHAEVGRGAKGARHLVLRRGHGLHGAVALAAHGFGTTRTNVDGALGIVQKTNGTLGQYPFIGYGIVAALNERRKVSIHDHGL